jgi:hypothetical protein
MAHGTTSSGDRGRNRSLTRLVMIACAGALLAWAIVPSGAGGQQYPLPTPTATPPPPAPVPPGAPVPPPGVAPPAKAASLALVTPFPIVRVVGRATKRGTTITLLTVHAPVGSYVVSRCVGTSSRCPYAKRVSRIRGTRGQTRTIHVRAFERWFRAGVLLRIYVVNAGRIGKSTSFKIRSGRRPKRNDGCVADFVLRPVSCSGG